MTDYIILRKNENENPEWVQIATVTESSSARRALSGANLGEGIYVAVPSRSWHPLIVTVEQTTKVTIR